MDFVHILFGNKEKILNTKKKRREKYQRQDISLSETVIPFDKTKGQERFYEVVELSSPRWQKCKD